MTPAHGRRLRLLAMTAAGLVAGTVGWVVLGWQFAPAIGWLAAALLYDIWVWTSITGMDAAATRTHAQTEDDGRRIIEALILVANISSLAAVIVVLAQPADERKVLAAALALAATSASWLLVQTVFTLHYARVYYTEPIGGINFNSADEPDYLDFAYMAFSLGMTYQVSDTDITQRPLRRVALVHSVVAFVFGMFVLATTINVVIGLAN